MGKHRHGTQRLQNNSRCHHQPHSHHQTHHNDTQPQNGIDPPVTVSKLKTCSIAIKGKDPHIGA
ncbi:MAG: hypothetical protein MJK04_20015 [Psychrosphaera sp.]|nr:hypothetical protein [Psychrosphaera sp.]